MQRVYFLVSDQYQINYMAKRIEISMFRPSLYQTTPRQNQKANPFRMNEEWRFITHCTSDCRIAVPQLSSAHSTTYLRNVPLAECAIKIRGIRKRFFLLHAAEKGNHCHPSFSVIMEMIIIYKRSRRSRRCDEVAEWKEQVNSLKKKGWWMAGDVTEQVTRPSDGGGKVWVVLGMGIE